MTSAILSSLNFSCIFARQFDYNSNHMANTTEEIHPFLPGTTGWSVHDLDNNPDIERVWELGHYEILEGALISMPPALFDAGLPFGYLIRIVQRHFMLNDIDLIATFETDLILKPHRVVRPDAAFTSANDIREQLKHPPKKRGRKYGRLQVPPTLIIENISPGHELQDREVKYEWYAEFGVPNYWIFDAYAKRLQCFKLALGQYKLDVEGRRNDKIRPGLFPGLEIDLKQVWL